MLRQTTLLRVNYCSYTEIETKIKEDETRWVERQSSRWETI